MGETRNDQTLCSRSAISVAVTAALTGTSAAQAQDGGLEEIIVTATKREVSMQDVPLAVTAFSDEQITLQRFSNFEDYATQIPGLAVSNRQPGANTVIMRGCAAQGLSFSDSATTSIYLDEQPITAAGYNPDPRLIDVARVEALSGPQGTLFGDAAQCGTLRIITNKPDPTGTYGWADVTGFTVTDGGAGYDVSGMANLPLIEDRLALRLVGFYADEPGWIDNVLAPTPGLAGDNSERIEEDVNSSAWSGGRFALRFLPSDAWTIDLAGIYQSYELEGFGDVALNQQLYADTSVFPEFGPREQARYTEESWNDDWYQLALTMEGKLGFGDVVLTTAYYERETAYFADSTAYLQTYQQLGDYFRSFNTGDPYYDTGGIYDFGGDPIANDFDERQTTNFSAEARYATPVEGRWSAIVGAFYNRREVEELFIANVQNLTGTPAFAYLNYAGYYFNGIPPKAESNNWFSGTYDSELTSLAVFGEATFDLTENFSITAGGRYYSIENDYIVKNAALVGLNGGAPDCSVDYCYTPGFLGKSDEEGFVPKLSVTYTLDDKLVYATYSEGFRRGGANSARPQSVFGPPGSAFPPPAGTLNEYESDTVINYEIGAKTDWFDSHLRVNLAIYRMTWEDIQVQAEDPQDLFTLGIVNFPEAEIDGAEVWLSWLPNEHWSLEATLGLNEGELSKARTLFAGSPGAISVPVGTPLPLVPDVKGSVNLTYTFSNTLFGAEPYLLTRFAYTGESVNSLAGVEAIASSFITPVRTHDAYQTLDLQFGLETSTWLLSLYVDNVTDENAQLFFNNRFAQQRLSVNMPRSYGVYFRYRFGEQ